MRPVVKLAPFAVLLFAACAREPSAPAPKLGGAGQKANVAASPTPTGTSVLAKSASKPHGLAVDAMHLYWVDEAGAVSKVVKSGGATTRLASGPAGATGIALDSKYLYWTAGGDDGVVSKVGKDGSGAKQLATKQPTPRDIAVDDGALYWINATEGSVVRASKDGGDPQKLTRAWANPRSLVLADEALYFVSATPRGAVVRVLKDGYELEAKRLIETTSPDVVALGKDTVFFGGGGNMFELAKTGEGKVTTIVEHEHPSCLTADATNMYWTDPHARTVWKMARTKGARPVAIATDQKNPYAIVVDSTHVYWTNEADGTIARASK